MKGEKYREAEKKFLSYGSDKYPKTGLIDSVVSELKDIGFTRIQEIRSNGTNKGSIWICCGRFLSIKRTTPGVDDSKLELMFFDASEDAESWLN